MVILGPITPVPNYINRELKFFPHCERAREAWLENMDSPDEKKLGVVPLHPDVFGVMPRIDIIHKNVLWQTLYKFVVCNFGRFLF